MPLFIVVEGLDGLGKSTLAASLAEVLDAKLVRTPGVLRQNIDALRGLPQHQAYPLFLADRILTYHTLVKPALDAGQHVVCDRYNLSNYAYQALAVGRERVLGDASNIPHLLLYCDGPLELATHRRAERRSQETGGLAQYEDPARLVQTKDMYDEAIRRYPSIFCDDLELIDATQSREGMLAASIRAVQESLLQNDPSAVQEAARISRELASFLASRATVQP